MSWNVYSFTFLIAERCLEDRKVIINKTTEYIRWKLNNFKSEWRRPDVIYFKQRINHCLGVFATILAGGQQGAKCIACMKKKRNPMLNIFRKISNLENLWIVNLRSYIGHRVCVSNVCKFVWLWNLFNVLRNVYS